MRYSINIVLLTMLVLVSTAYTVDAGNIGKEVIDTANTLQGTIITVASPNGGESWLIGTTHTIKWSSTGKHRSNVRIELFKAGILNRTISVSTANDGSYRWKIPSVQVLGTDYRIKITNLSNMADYDFSNDNFTLNGPSITVTSPNGGENWAKGTIHTIEWNRIDSTGSRVKIELFRGNTLSHTISSRTSNDGSYFWTVPSSQALDSNYMIKITSTSNPEYYDWSDNNFRIS